MAAFVSTFSALPTRERSEWRHSGVPRRTASEGRGVEGRGLELIDAVETVHACARRENITPAPVDPDIVVATLERALGEVDAAEV